MNLPGLNKEDLKVHRDLLLAHPEHDYRVIAELRECELELLHRDLREMDRRARLQAEHVAAVQEDYENRNWM